MIKIWIASQRLRFAWIFILLAVRQKYLRLLSHKKRTFFFMQINSLVSISMPPNGFESVYFLLFSAKGPVFWRNELHSIKLQSGFSWFVFSCCFCKLSSGGHSIFASVNCARIWFLVPYLSPVQLYCFGRMGECLTRRIRELSFEAILRQVG